MRKIRRSLNEFKNKYGLVALWYYSIDESYQIIWNYAEYDKRFDKYYIDSLKERSLKFFSLKTALLKYQEIYLDLININQPKNEFTTSSELENMEWYIIKSIKKYFRYLGCINCGEHGLKLQIDSENGEISGICWTCRFSNSLQQLLIFEKKLRDKRIKKN